jgi:hypothetical protein
MTQGGVWLNGRADGIDWTDVMVVAGVACGAPSRMDIAEQRPEQGNLEPGHSAPLGDYDDPAAVLAGEWGHIQRATATVFSRIPTDDYFQEVQIRLRSTIEPHSSTGYEIFWRCLKTDGGYAEIVRWNGAVGDFTSLRRLVGPDFGVTHGDIVEATADGNTLKGFINGVEVICVDDGAFSTGCPGIGFNFGVGKTNIDHGFTSFAVQTFE